MANKDRYQVRYEWKGETRYGIARTHEKSSKAGFIVIDDAILPMAVEVKDDSKVVDIPFGKDFPTYDPNTGYILKGGSEYDLYVDKASREADKVSKAAGKGVVVGKLFNIGVADGHATYIVTKVTKTKATVEWRGFGGGDRYTDHFFGFGPKTVPIKDVQQYIGRQEGMADYFEKKQDDAEALLDSLAVGSIVHSGDRWGKFVRYEVVKDGNGKAYKPVGMVGPHHESDLPRRYYDGTEHIPYGAQQIIDGKLVKSLRAEEVWESPKWNAGNYEDGQRLTPDKKGKTPDPTGKPCINLTLPPMTAGEAEVARLWQVVYAVKKAVTVNPSSPHPSQPQEILAEAYKLLRTELAGWTVDDFSNNGLKDNRLSD